MRHDETGWQRRKCIEKSLKNPPTVTHRHLPKKSLICQAMGFSATCAWRYLVDHFQARFPISHRGGCGSTSSVTGWLVGWLIHCDRNCLRKLRIKAFRQRPPGEVWHQWLCLFLRDVFVTKKGWFFKTGVHQHETCHVTVHVSVVFFCWVLFVCFFCLKHA